MDVSDLDPTPEQRLGDASRRTLLRLAREAILEQLTRGEIPRPEVDDAALIPPSGAFVSLHMEGELRGCIGSLEPGKAPLHRTVCRMAVAAATDDPRFRPLRKDELRFTELEISVLGPLVHSTPEDVVVGVHGLYVVRGSDRGVLLPQVALQYGWDRESFLGHTCRKAGLPIHAWKKQETRLWTFTAEVFSDADYLEG